MDFPKNICFVTLLLLLSHSPITLAHNETEHSPGNKDAIKGSTTRTAVYEKHRPNLHQPNIDLPSGGAGNGRIAIESDGNVFASDDLGAIPFGLAILWKKDRLKDIVHFAYNNNANKDRHANEAKDTPGLYQNVEYSSIIDNCTNTFELNKDVVFNYEVNDEQSSATENLAKEINISSATNPLYIIQAGAMLYLYNALAASDTSKHQYITVITHSGWNDIECDNSDLNQNIIDILRDFKTVKFDYIKDQNYGNDIYGGLRSKNGWTAIDWMRTSENDTLNWLYSCAQKGDPNRWGFFNLSTEVDISDAGMFHYFVTGDEDSSFEKIKMILNQTTPNNLKHNIKQDLVFKLYPNPCKGKVYVDYTISSEKINVYDIKGKLIFSKISSEIPTPISIEDNGVYFIQIRNKCQKLIVN